MTAILAKNDASSLWARFCEWITSTENRLYIGWFGVIMIPTLLTATSVFIIAFIAAPPVDIDGIREPVSGSLLYGNNIISGAVVPTSNAIGLHFYPIWEAASLDEWLYNGGPYQLIVCHFFLGVCCYMGREWELSYRLGMRRGDNAGLLTSNACPEEQNEFSLQKDVSREIPHELGELQGKRRHKIKGFALPVSIYFLTIIEKRKQNGKDIYLEYMEKMKEKKPDYVPIKDTVPNATNSDFFDTKKGVIVYLEKHRILPGHQTGKYNEENVVLLTFPQHVMAHYIRYLQYGDLGDHLAVNQMLRQNNAQFRRDMASYAGKLGGKKQQQNLRDQNRGWFNSEVQRELGRKGALAAKKKGVGAFDPQNLLDALSAWQIKFQQDPKFRQKMLNNFQQGLKTQSKLRINIYDPVSQRHRVINGKGISIDGKIVLSPYLIVYSDETFEYSEHRIHLSEDFYWNHIKNRPLGKRTNYKNPKPK
jgi:hypothetical protein